MKDRKPGHRFVRVTEFLEEVPISRSKCYVLMAETPSRIVWTQVGGVKVIDLPASLERLGLVSANDVAA